MRNPFRARLCISLLLAVVLGSVPANAQDADRRARIISNLKEQTNLGNMEVDVVRLEPSRYDQLDQGTILVRTPNGPVEVAFLLSKDDKQFYLINGQPIDVSEDPEEKRLARAAVIAEAMSNRPKKGNLDGTQIIAEFSDFQCPYCARAVDPINGALNQRDDALVVFFQLPIESIHPWAKQAAIATECAFQQDQEAFWTLHDGLFPRQDTITTENIRQVSRDLLSSTGIDLDVWQACESGDDVEAYAVANARVQADMELANQLQVQSTPTIFVNGERFRGAVPAETIVGAMK